MASNYVNIPSGAAHWKSPVVITSDLPLNGNSVGDVRLAEDTNTIYVWDGANWIAVATPGAAIAIDALLGDVTATGPGAVPATVAFVGGQTAANVASATILVRGNQSGNKVFASPANGSSGAPAFRTLVTADLPAGTGTVTSVALTAPASILSVAGSPVTTAGTLALSLVTQAANSVWAGPTSGSAAAPTFRALVNADIPNPNSTTKNANYTILSTDSVIFADTSGGAFNLTLPDPTTLSGAKIYRIIDSTGSFNTNNCTLVPHGAEKISGLAANRALQANWGFYTITTNNVDWFLG